MTPDNQETIEVSCPRCSTPNQVGRDADVFCSNCDFPLVWAEAAATVQRPAVRAAAVGEEPESGTPSEDEDDLDDENTDIICRNCALRNPGDRTYCLRCGEELHRPEEWYREGETHVEAEAEPTVFLSAAVAVIGVFLGLCGAFLILMYPADAVWPDQVAETKLVLKDAEGVSATSVVIVDDLPVVAYYADNDSKDPTATDSSLSMVLCGNTQCGEGKLIKGAFEVDPEGTPGRRGIAMVRVAGGALAVYRREETGSLVAVECGTPGCDDQLGTRRFFPIDEGDLTDQEVSLAVDLVALGTASDDVAARLSVVDAADGEAVNAIATSLDVALETFNSENSGTTGFADLLKATRDLGVRADAAMKASSLEDTRSVNGELAALLAEQSIGVGFSPVMAVSGGVPAVAYMGKGNAMQLAFLCGIACVDDDDGVVNLDLSERTNPGSPISLAFPRAGSPFIVFINSTGTLSMLRCKNSTCDEFDNAGKRSANTAPVSLAKVGGTMIQGVFSGENQLSMIIDPNTLAPEIAFIRADTTSSDGEPVHRLYYLDCADQNCQDGSIEEIDSWIGERGELEMARGEKGAPVIAYRKIVGDAKTAQLFVATCSPCDEDHKWIVRDIDKGEEEGTNSGRVWPVWWWPWNETPKLEVGYNISMSVVIDDSEETAVITHTDIDGTRVRVTRVDLLKLSDKCGTGCVPVPIPGTQ